MDKNTARRAHDHGFFVMSGRSVFVIAICFAFCAWLSACVNVEEKPDTKTQIENDLEGVLKFALSANTEKATFADHEVNIPLDIGVEGGTPNDIYLYVEKYTAYNLEQSRISRFQTRNDAEEYLIWTKHSYSSSIDFVLELPDLEARYYAVELSVFGETANPDVWGLGSITIFVVLGAQEPFICDSTSLFTSACNDVLPETCDASAAELEDFEDNLTQCWEDGFDLDEAMDFPAYEEPIEE